MGSYDYDVLGAGNPNHPANQQDFEDSEFTSNNIQEAFKHYKNTDDLDLITSVLDNNTTTVNKSIEQLTIIINQVRELENVFIANKLCEIRNELKTLLK